MKDPITILERQIAESDTSDTEVGQQRERNHRYYSMQPLGNERKGRSHYVDPAVFGSVEDKKSVFDETFLSSRKAVWFSGPNANESEAKTAYVQRVLKANKYTKIFKDGWHDAFVAKRMTVWVDWRRAREKVTLRFLGAPSQMVNQHLAQLGEIVGVNREGLESHPIPSIGQQQYVHTGELVVDVEASYLALELVKPELVFRDPNQAYAEDAGWNACRLDLTRLELINRDFDPDQVRKLKPGERISTTSLEDAARKAHDQSHTRATDGNGMTGDHEEVSIYRTRTWLTPEDAAGIEGVTPASQPAIYDIHWAGKEILRYSDGSHAVKIIDDMWVHEWSEIKISHAENGLCTADVEAHQQKAASGIKRGIMDNMNITNNPMWEVNADGIRDMRDLLDGVIAGVVETESGLPPGQVQALQMPQLSPLVMGVLQMIDRDGEERSGVSTLSRGLNADVISNQNAESMVDKVMSRGERRVAMAARSFANDFLVPLSQCIVKVGMKYDKSQSMMESGGRKVPIIPAQWTDTEHEMDVQTALTPQEAQEMAGRLLGLNSTLSQDESIAILYGLPQKHALYDTVFELMGIKDSTKFLGTPESPQVRQAMQSRQQQMAQAQAKQDQMAAFQMRMLGDNSAREWAKLNNTIMDTIADNNREDKDQEWQKWVDIQELSIERQQDRGVSVG